MKAVICILAVLLLGACVHVPDDDVVIKVFGPRGTAILLMDKGYLDKENHGKNWIYKHEFEERMKGVK